LFRSMCKSSGTASADCAKLGLSKRGDVAEGTAVTSERARLAAESEAERAAARGLSITTRSRFRLKLARWRGSSRSQGRFCALISIVSYGSCNPLTYQGPGKFPKVLIYALCPARASTDLLASRTSKVDVSATQGMLLSLERMKSRSASTSRTLRRRI
jgi:hypothetical protein